MARASRARALETPATSAIALADKRLARTRPQMSARATRSHTPACELVGRLRSAATVLASRARALLRTYVVTRQANLQPDAARCSAAGLGNSLRYGNHASDRAAPAKALYVLAVVAGTCCRGRLSEINCLLPCTCYLRCDCTTQPPRQCTGQRCSYCDRRIGARPHTRLPTSRGVGNANDS